MRFVVTQMPLNEVDVKLAFETKEKLRKIAIYGYYTAIGAALGTLYCINQKNKNK